ncbi:MAG: NAD(P)-binding domain-containing protein [Firmicutes bacterium]|nr:NAD(P)-binding domain-containing protein [Bacillota bacterium]
MKKYALIGENISYSFSPKLHEFLFQHFNRRASYDLLDIEADVLEKEFLNIVKEYDGFNVTTPYKNTVFSKLQLLSDGAKCTGSVNTVVKFDGRVVGYNTDLFGINQTFKRNFSLGGAAYSLSGKTVLVIGAGDTARTLIHYLLTQGSNVIVLARNLQKIKEMRDYLQQINSGNTQSSAVKNTEFADEESNDTALSSDYTQNGNAQGDNTRGGNTQSDAGSAPKNPTAKKLAIKAKNYTQAHKGEIVGMYVSEKDISKPYNIVINTTPLGNANNINQSPLNLSILKSAGATGLEFVLDTAYTPEKTQLLKNADSLNIRNTNGFTMLLFQALKSQEVWLGRTVKPSRLEQVYNEIRGILYNN